MSSWGTQAENWKDQRAFEASGPENCRYATASVQANRFHEPADGSRKLVTGPFGHSRTPRHCALKLPHRERYPSSSAEALRRREAFRRGYRTGRSSNRGAIFELPLFAPGARDGDSDERIGL